MGTQHTTGTTTGSAGVVKSPARQAIYTFESGNDTKRERDEAVKRLPALADRLGINTTTISAQDNECLINYIIQHHLNIEWYFRGQAREKKRRKRFFIASLALLLLIPLSIFALTYIWPGENTVAALTAGLTGLLGIHRTFSEWFDKRKLVGLFWKASADLKENLYTFEDIWKHKPKQNQTGLTDDFKAALAAETKKARAIVRAETEQFYQNVSTPTIDLHAELKKSQAQAAEMMDLFIAPTAKKALAREQTERTIRGLEARMAELDRLIFEKLQAFTDPAMPPERKKQLEAVIQDLEEKRIAAEMEHTKMKEKLAAL